MFETPGASGGRESSPDIISSPTGITFPLTTTSLSPFYFHMRHNIRQTLMWAYTPSKEAAMTPHPASEPLLEAAANGVSQIDVGDGINFRTPSAISNGLHSPRSPALRRQGGPAAYSGRGPIVASPHRIRASIHTRMAPGEISDLLWQLSRCLRVSGGLATVTMFGAVAWQLWRGAVAGLCLGLLYLLCANHASQC